MAGQTRADDATPRRGEPPSTCCSPDHSLPDSDLADDVRILAALGDDTRYGALRVVAAADDGVCVCDLKECLGVSQGAVSQALSRLFGAGLVDGRTEGR